MREREETLKSLAAAEKDAARYRWLRQQESWIPPKEQFPAWYQGPIKWIGGPYSENEIDDMVDYAMKLSPGDTAEEGGAA